MIYSNKLSNQFRIALYMMILNLLKSCSLETAIKNALDQGINIVKDVAQDIKNDQNSSSNSSQDSNEDSQKVIKVTNFKTMLKRFNAVVEQHMRLEQSSSATSNKKNIEKIQSFHHSLNSLYSKVKEYLSQEELNELKMFSLKDLNKKTLLELLGDENKIKNDTDEAKKFVEKYLPGSEQRNIAENVDKVVSLEDLVKEFNSSVSSLIKLKILKSSNKKLLDDSKEKVLVDYLTLQDFYNNNLKDIDSEKLKGLEIYTFEDINNPTKVKFLDLFTSEENIYKNINKLLYYINTYKDVNNQSPIREADKAHTEALIPDQKPESLKDMLKGLPKSIHLNNFFKNLSFNPNIYNEEFDFKNSEKVQAFKEYIENYNITIDDVKEMPFEALSYITYAQNSNKPNYTESVIISYYTFTTVFKDENHFNQSPYRILTNYLQGFSIKELVENKGVINNYFKECMQDGKDLGAAFSLLTFVTYDYGSDRHIITTDAFKECFTDYEKNYHSALSAIKNKIVEYYTNHCSFKTPEIALKILLETFCLAKSQNVSLLYNSIARFFTENPNDLFLHKHLLDNEYLTYGDGKTTLSKYSHAKSKEDIEGFFNDEIDALSCRDFIDGLGGYLELFD